MKRKTRNCCMAVLLLAAILLCGCMKRVDNQDSAIFVQDAAQTEIPEPKTEEAAEVPNAEAGESTEPENAPEEQNAGNQAGEENTAESPALTEAAEETAAAEGPEATATATETDTDQEPQPEPAPVPGLKNADGTIEITVPARYADTRYRMGDVTWNADDSATYRLTEEEHEQLLAEVHDDIQAKLDEMRASPYFPNFDSITANEDCTVFTVVCLTIETSRAEQESLIQIYELGRMYAAYRGEAAGNIHLDFRPKTGFTFVTRDSEKDLAAN